jgi:hypothetical protein
MTGSRCAVLDAEPEDGLHDEQPSGVQIRCAVPVLRAAPRARRCSAVLASELQRERRDVVCRVVVVSHSSPRIVGTYALPVDRPCSDRTRRRRRASAEHSLPPTVRRALLSSSRDLTT